MPVMADPLGCSLVGRDAELARIGTILDGAVRGESSALVIFGEAGVGKTALVREACALARPEMLRLDGVCLPLQTVKLPLLPLRNALRSCSAPGATECLAEFEVADRAPRALDAWLETATSSTPVIVIVDDLQWADQSTLDVLLYLLAGPADRRLAVLVTVRTHALPDGHPLHRWLADVLRLPRVHRMVVPELDRAGTEAQLARLMGAAPHQSLVDEVFLHTHGNAYLNQLISRDLQPSTRELPTSLPADLASAVRRAWHALSPPGRTLASLTAVAGRPERADVLQAVADDLGLGEVASCLAEAVDLGVLEEVDADRYWFHHPVQAQVLERAMTSDQRRRWHAAFARQIEKSMPGSSSAPLELALGAASHHDQAGHMADAYAWALRCWEVAGDARGSPELLRLLWRAIDLNAQLPDPPEALEDLLQRVRAAAESVGADREELAATDALLQVMDAQASPLPVAELRLRRRHLWMTTGAGMPDIDDIDATVRIVSALPDTWQHALALAELARTCVWADEAKAAKHAERALAIARASGNARALSHALTANAMVALRAHRGDDARAFAARAVEQAVAAADWWAFIHGVMWELNSGFEPIRTPAAEHLRMRRGQLVARGAPHSIVAQLCAIEAEANLLAGNWRTCQHLLRVTLGSDPGPLADLRSRLAAALLDAWQGRTDDARSHLDRVDELVAAGSHYPNLPIQAVKAIVAAAAGQPEDAYLTALATTASPGLPVDYCEWLIPVAAESLADQIEAVRDRGDEPTAQLEQLAILRTEFPHVLSARGQLTSLMRTQVSAMQTWYDAEVARARQEDAVELWVCAAGRFAVVRLPWIEAYAWWRAADALLAHGLGRRNEGVRALRRGYALAEDLQARPILDELHDLAKVARVRIDRAETGEPPSNASLVLRPVVPGLTAREREILAHLITGATYAEIAASLVISEKTVSSHVSNLLRKSGTSSRIELSRLALRVEQAGRDQGEPTR